MTLVEEAKALDWDGRAPWRARCRCASATSASSRILVRADRDLLALADASASTAEAASLRGWIARSHGGLRRGCGLRTGPIARSTCVTGKLAADGDLGGLPAALRPRRRTRPGRTGIAALAARAGWTPASIALAEQRPGLRRPTIPHRYWRGPVWLVVNRMIADGFAAYGRTDLADRLLERHARGGRCAHGLREYFDPRTGEGLGGRDFSWTAATWLAWKKETPLLTAV